MRHLVTIAAMALLLACGQQASEAPTTNVPEAADGNESAGEAPLGDASSAEGAGTEPGMRWAFARTAAGPKLTYGEPNTDNLKLMLRCAGEDGIRLSFMRPAGAAGGEFVLRSGGAQAQVNAIAEESQIGGTTIQATAPSAAEPLQNFRSGSPLGIGWQGETVSVPAAGEEARQFFEACRASG